MRLPPFSVSFLLFSSLCMTSPALAIDLDDDIAPDTEEHISYQAAANIPSDNTYEKQFPQEAKEVRAALDNHFLHANAKDLDAYMSDFLPERIRYMDLERDYASRAMALQNLKLELKAVEFQKLSRTAATIHTRQITSYLDASGQPQIDDAIISYRWIKDSNDGIWKIAFTERRRLTKEDN